MNFSDNQMNMLLEIAAKKMGIDPDKLRQQIESGNPEALLSQLGSNQQAQLAGMLNNAQALEQLINNPQIQNLLKNLMK